MKRSPLQWLILPAFAWAALAAGCAARTPQQPLTAAPGQADGQAVGSTTGDADACAAALGNAVPGTPADSSLGYMAGTLRPRVTDGMATGLPPGVGGTAEGNATAGAPGSPAAGPTGNIGVAGMPSDGARGLSGLGAQATPEVSADGVIIGNIALVAVPTTDEVPVSPSPGQAALTETASANLSAFERVRTACTSLAQIRVVTEAQDRQRLAEATAAMRRGEPVIDFLSDLVAISRRASETPGTAARSTESGLTVPAPAGAPGGPVPGNGATVGPTVP